VQLESNVSDSESTREEENIPQATVEAGEDFIIMSATPDIELSFSDDEHIIELARYY